MVQLVLRFVSCCLLLLVDGSSPPCSNRYFGRCPEEPSLRCHSGSYLISGMCLPYTNQICEQDSYYDNGFCQQRQPCHIATMGCRITRPLHPCGLNSVTYDGRCVECPYLTIAEHNTCMRKDITTPHCPTGTQLISGSCVRDVPCPENTINIRGICALCPIGLFPRNEQCIHAESWPEGGTFRVLPQPSCGHYGDCSPHYFNSLPASSDPTSIDIPQSMIRNHNPY